MDYGDNPRVNVMTNHSHIYGPEKQESRIRFEGEKGAIEIRAGLNMDYPHGVPDCFDYILLDDAEGAKWRSLDIKGSWFPEAFIGTMASVMRAARGETEELPTAVEDAIETMATVEAAYLSSEGDGTQVPADLDSRAKLKAVSDSTTATDHLPRTRSSRSPHISV